jgi:hypothetical protein
MRASIEAVWNLEASLTPGAMAAFARLLRKLAWDF